MALQKCGLNLNQKLKELQPHGTLDFPCGGYSARYLESQGEGVPWHWHEELEVGYVADGTMEVKVPSQSFLLEKGDGFAINSNVLHSGAPVGECEVHSMVFLPSLIYGKESSVFAEKYIKPLLACHAFAGSMLSKEKDTDALKGICQAFDGLRKAEAGFEFTVREVVMMGRAPHKKALERDNAKDYEIVEEALKTVGMEGFAQRSFSTLSGGEQQRVILARALAQQTPCLILDEPTNHLDITHQLQLMRIVKNLSATVISAIHDLNIAAMFCDRIYALKEGRIIAQGTPREVLTEDFIRQVYQVDAEIAKDSSGQMHILFKG